MDVSAMTRTDSTWKKKKKKKEKTVSLDDVQWMQEEEELGQDTGESAPLLPLQKTTSLRRGSNLRAKAGSGRRVQWNDKLGNKLEYVREFVPSDSSDDNYEDEDLDSCMCSVM